MAGEPSSSLSDLQDLRLYLHAHPEVSNAEFETSAYLRERLSKLPNVHEIIMLDQTGFAVVFKGGAPGPRIMLRCELDALPIHEINTFAHRSSKAGVSHKCGHDGHMTMLVAVAHAVNAHPPVQGEIILLFQSAEETGDGAVNAIQSPDFERIAPDYVYALHNIPGKPLGAVLVKEGAFTPSVKSLILRFNGRTSHAAEPEHGLNPALLMAEILYHADQVTLNDTARDDFFLITPIYQTLGEQAYGISAGYGELHLTLRAWDQDFFDAQCNDFLAAAQRIAQTHGIELTHKWCFAFQANTNHQKAVEVIRVSASTAGCTLIDMPAPFKFGEDFGIFTQRYPGAMFGLGAGEACKALHNPDYDFPDALLEIGPAIFREILNAHGVFTAYRQQ